MSNLRSAIRRAIRRLMVAGLYNRKSTPDAVRNNVQILRMPSSPVSEGGFLDRRCRAKVRMTIQPGQFSGNALPEAARNRRTRHVTALSGMDLCWADSGSCAKAMPPCALMAFMPCVPSEAVPERMTPIALLPRSSASERKKWSMGRFLRAIWIARCKRQTPPSRSSSGRSAE